MAYLCVDKMGGELISDEYPERGFRGWNGWRDVYGETCTLISLPTGTIKALIGREMTWEDEPYEMPLNMFTD
jgi:hypothetical protein